jgi:hypothetical protein
MVFSATHATGSVLMCSHNCTVEHENKIRGLLLRCLADPLPNAAAAPTCETSVDSFPFTKTHRQIAPWRACSQNPQDTFNKISIVFAAGARISRFS